VGIVHSLSLSRRDQQETNEKVRPGLVQRGLPEGSLSTVNSATSVWHDMIYICLWTHRKWAAVQVILLQPRKELMCKNKTIATHDSYWQTSCNYIMMLSCMKLLEIVGTLHAQQKKWAQVGSLHTLLLNLTTDLSSRLHSKKNAISLFKNFHPVLANVDISRLTADVMTVTGN
jgi:hypothetical protein